MLDGATRHQLSDELLRRFGAALRGVQLYSPTHPIVTRNLDLLAEGLHSLVEADGSVVIGVLGEELIVGDLPMSKASASMGELIRRLSALGIERITFTREVTAEELKGFVERFGRIEKNAGKEKQEESAAQ